MPRVLLKHVLTILIFCTVFLFPLGFQSPTGFSDQKPAAPVTKPINTPAPGPDAATKPAATHAMAEETDPVKPLPPEPVPETPVPTGMVPDTTTPPPAEPNQPIRFAEVQDKVGLSFDDGPYPVLTEEYLQVLETHQVRATFFVIGQQVKSYPAVSKKIVDQGSEIGSHSWRHAQLDKLSAEELKNDLTNVANEVYAATNSTVTLFRPPYGRFNDNVLAAARQLDQRAILWNVDPRDWDRNPTAQQVAQRVLEQTQPGSIILLHEGYTHTLEALPLIISKLRERGLEPVPISQLLE